MHANATSRGNLRTLALTCTALVLGCFPGQAQEQIYTGSPQPSLAPMITDEKIVIESLLNVVNQYRFERGLDALVINERLNVIAKKHALAMMNTGYAFDYDFSNRWLEAKAANKRLVSFAENDAFSFPVKGIPGQVLQKWVKKARYNRNLLNRDFGETGIGLAMDRDGNIFVSQNFAHLKPIPAGKKEMAMMDEEGIAADSDIEITEQIDIGVQDLQ